MISIKFKNLSWKRLRSLLSIFFQAWIVMFFTEISASPCLPEGTELAQQTPTFPSLIVANPTTQTRALFFIYREGEHSKSLQELIPHIVVFSKQIKINIIIPSDSRTSFENDPFKNLLQNYGSQIHLIPVSWAGVNKEFWIQDKFIFLLKNNQPVIYWVAQWAEHSIKPITKQLAFELGAKCGFEVIEPEGIKEIGRSGFSAGGNFVALPMNDSSNNNNGNNILMTGYAHPISQFNHQPQFEFNIMNMDRFEKRDRSGKEFIYYTVASHEAEMVDLEKKGMNILRMDTGFLDVGHTDEIFTTIKAGKGVTHDLLLWAMPLPSNDNSPTKGLFPMIKKAMMKNKTILEALRPSLDLEFLAVPTFITNRGRTTGPNMINGINLIDNEGNSLYLFPKNNKNGVESQENFIRHLKDKGVMATPINFDFAHREGGGLHCASKVLSF